MRYVFGEFLLDSMSLQLLHKGVEIDLPRRAHLLLNHLIEQRERVVKRDELIRKIWGRDNVSDHQLAQLVRAARQVLGDNGDTQSMIRTVMGVGYHWVGEIAEVPAIEAPAVERSVVDAQRPTPEIAPVPKATSANAAAPWQNARVFRFWGGVAPVIIASLLLAWSPNTRELSASQPMPIAEQTLKANLHSLQAALAQGQFEQVREGLAHLPNALIESPQGRMLAIELDIERGRWPQASQKLALQLQRAQAAGDAVWQVQLGLLHTKILQFSGAPKAELVATSVALVQQLQASTIPVAPELMAGAIKRRGSSWLLTGKLENAALDFAQARDLYLRANDQRAATQASCSLARVWMRQGRLVEALEQVSANADTYAKLSDPISELFARNTALRIQVELLRWPDALASSERAMQLLKLIPNSERSHRSLQLRAMVLTLVGRLREAESILEEAQAQQLVQNPTELADAQIIPTLHHLASKRYLQALESAEAAFLALPTDPHNILFDGRDGALLLWVMAAEKWVGAGEALPTPSSAQSAVLHQPETTLARIAQGRWLSLVGEAQNAKRILRQAINDSRQQNHLYRMLLAGEPLMELFDRSGDVAGAQRVLTELRAQDPIHIDQARQMRVLDSQFNDVVAHTNFSH